jgi:hypothetical protein
MDLRRAVADDLANDEAWIKAIGQAIEQAAPKDLPALLAAEAKARFNRRSVLRTIERLAAGDTTPSTRKRSAAATEARPRF